MTDAEKLREAAVFLLRADNSNKEWADDLYRIAALLDAVPPETLAAIQAGTVVTVDRSALSIVLGWLQASLGDKPSWNNTSYADAVNAVQIFQAALSAAPAKPEE